MLIVCAAAGVVAGCEKKEPIQTYTAPKDPPMMAASAGGADGGSEHSSEPHVHWTVPDGWKPTKPGSMIYAAFQVSENPPMNVTVSSAAGSVLANVNRWRGQLGLPPFAQESELSQVVSPLKVGGADGAMVDLMGGPAAEGKPQQRMLVAMVPGAGTVWFFKAMGPAEKVAEVKPAFDAFVKSVHFDGEDGHGAQAQADPHAGLKQPAGAEMKQPAAGEAAKGGAAGKMEGIAAYALPEGWKVDAQARPMRVGTIVVPGDNGQAELAVSRFNAASYADKKGNINRWRGQVMLPPADAAEQAQAVETGSGKAEVFDFAGPEDQGAGRKRLLVAVLPQPGSDQIWFFRLLGPHDLVGKSKPAFEAFVKSLKLDHP